jgi:protein O-GlcNAc transferase
VPVLTLAGDRMIARQGASIVANAGLADWIAGDEDDYVGKAVRFALDVEGLAALRRDLRPRALASPLFDGPRFARDFAAALEGIWETGAGGRTRTDTSFET